MAHTILDSLGELDKPHVVRMLHHAFAAEHAGVEKWLTASGLEQVRVLRDRTGDGVSLPQACLLRVPMGQYWGGRSVSQLGIAGVAVAPEQRGRGRAREMMRACVRAAYAEGFALSSLFASTHALYRQVGYEHAGVHCECTVPLVRIDVPSGRSQPLSALTQDDAPRVRACYEAFAREYDGMLDRGAYVWGRVTDYRGESYAGFGVERASGGPLEGYVYLRQSQREDGRQDIHLSDFVFLTPSAGERLWGFLRDFEMMGWDLSFRGAPTHPALALLRQQRYRVTLKDTWLVRVVNVETFLCERGYAPGLSTRVVLDVRDDVIAENQGAWELAIHDGRGQVRRLAQAPPHALRVEARGLAAITTGYVSAAQGARLGWAQGDESTLRAFAGVFGAGHAWMSDHF
jgi:predicted acetyltransferase